MNVATMEEVKAKFPHHSLIKNGALADCPACKGAGWFTNTLKREQPCLCVCMSETDNAVRRHAVESLRRAVATMKHELTANAGRQATASDNDQGKET